MKAMVCKTYLSRYIIKAGNRINQYAAFHNQCKMYLFHIHIIYIIITYICAIIAYIYALICRVYMRYYRVYIRVNLSGIYALLSRIYTR